MALFSALRSLAQDPPPSYAFELSQNGIAFSVRPHRRGVRPRVEFHLFTSEVLAITPVRDNVLQPEDFARHVASLIPPNGNRRRDAALILPDYSARVAMLDFESFPSDPGEQLSLVRFRLKKTVPFEMESASVSYQLRRSGKKVEALVAVAATEIVSRYEAPFRAAGFSPGFVTTSMLAALDLLPAGGLSLVVKMSGRVLTLAVCDGRFPKLLRTVEMETPTTDEVMGILYPTIAYAEDELPERPSRIYLVGFDDEELRAECENQLGIAAEPLRSSLGQPTGDNAGLLGFLRAQEAGA